MRSNSLNTVKYLAPVLCIAAAGISQTPVLVSANIATSTTWTANNVYRLENQIYVLPGATLTIAAGTLIASTANVGGSLAVCKGAQIYVNGTQSDPVIMTSTSDVATWVGGNPHTGTWRAACNEWGNLTIMGAAYVSENAILANTPAPNASNVGTMEGLVAGFPGDTRVIYGGGNDDDDSGSIRYLSLRYGGKVLGLGNELNGLSMGGVGRNTDIDYVEIMNNVDDGIEIWGGTVNLKHFSIWNVGDDSLDVDQGWRGKAQFGLIVQGYSVGAAQGSGVGDNCFEVDGAEQSDYQPVTSTTIYNCTVIGQPTGVNGGDHATAWRDGARVQYRNCIFMDIGDKLVAFDNIDGDGGSGYGFNGTTSWANCWTTPYSSYSTVNAPANPADFYRVQSSGSLCEIKDSVVFNNTSSVAYTEANLRGVFAASNNNVSSVLSPIQSITRGPAAVVFGSLVMAPVLTLDPRPAADALTSVGFAPNDGFFESAHYRGAFAPGCNWLAGWTASQAFGFTPNDGWADLGQSLLGITGAPVCSGTGTFAQGSNNVVSLTNGAPFALSVLCLGFSEVNFPVLGGTLIPNINTFGTVVTFTDAIGSAALNLGPIPGGFTSGTPFFFQYLVFDVAAPQGLSFSNGQSKRSS